MKLRKNRKNLILFILAIIIIICMLNLHQIIYFLAHTIISPSNDRAADKEIKKIVNSCELTQLEYQYTTKTDEDIYCIEFYCKDISEGDKILEESVDIYYKILKGIDRSSKLYNSRINLEVRGSPSLPDYIDLYNYQYDMASVHGKAGDISFYDLVSVKIACPSPITDLKPIEGSKDEIMFLRLDASFKTDDVDLSDFDKAIRNVNDKLN